MPVMAKARKRKGEQGQPIGPRKVVAQLKGSEEFGDWFNELLVFLRLPAPVALEHAIIKYAKDHGFTKPPPER